MWEYDLAPTAASAYQYSEATKTICNSERNEKEARRLVAGQGSETHVVRCHSGSNMCHEVCEGT